MKVNQKVNLRYCREGKQIHHGKQVNCEVTRENDFLKSYGNENALVEILLITKVTSDV